MSIWVWILVSYHGLALLVYWIDTQYPDPDGDERPWAQRVLQAELWGPLLLWVFWEELRASDGRRRG